MKRDGERRDKGKEGTSLEVPCPNEIQCTRHEGRLQHSRGGVMDSEGVSLETPWQNGLLGYKRRAPQRMEENVVNSERRMEGNNTEGALEKGVRIIQVQECGEIRGKATRNHRGVRKHGRTASPIAVKPPWIQF